MRLFELSATFIIMMTVPACGLLRPDYDPCPSDGTSAPVPGPVIEPVSVGAGDNYAGERYRKLNNGTVCVCGTYEIGCYETVEGAESSMSCGYDWQGQPECLPAERPPDPAFGWNNETGQDEPLKKGNWRCQTSGECKIGNQNIPHWNVENHYDKTEADARRSTETRFRHTCITRNGEPSIAESICDPI
jgi:hypothetical protein